MKTWTSQRPGRADSVRRSSKRSFRGQVIGLFSKGAWQQQVTRIEDQCHTHVSHKWLRCLDACAGSVLTPHEYIANVQKDSATGSGWVVGSVDAAALSWTHSWNMQKPAALPKPREDTVLAFTLLFAT